MMFKSFVNELIHRLFHWIQWNNRKTKIATQKKCWFALLIVMHIYFHFTDWLTKCPKKKFQSRNRWNVFLLPNFCCVVCKEESNTPSKRKKNHSKKMLFRFSTLSFFFLFFCGNLCYCYTQHVYVVLLHCFKRTQWLACLCVATIFNVYTLSTNPFYSLSISFAVSDFLISICRYIYVRSDEGKKKNCTMYRVWRLFVCVYCVWTMCIRFFHANVCVSVLFSVSSFILSLNSAHWSHTIL